MLSATRKSDFAQSLDPTRIETTALGSPRKYLARKKPRTVPVRITTVNTRRKIEYSERNAIRWEIGIGYGKTLRMSTSRDGNGKRDVSVRTEEQIGRLQEVSTACKALKTEIPTFVYELKTIMMNVDWFLITKNKQLQ